MRGPFVQISSMRHAVLCLAGGRYEVRYSNRINPNWTRFDTRQLGHLPQDYRNPVNLGAISPDLFFFFLRDKKFLEPLVNMVADYLILHAAIP